MIEQDNDLFEREIADLPPDAKSRAREQARRVWEGQLVSELTAPPKKPSEASDSELESKLNRLAFETATEPPPPWHERYGWAMGLLLLVGLTGGPMLVNHWGNCLFARTEILPVEDTTTELYFLRRHWFGKTERIKLEARPDENGHLCWMAKSDKNGEWFSFIRFE